MIAPAAVLLDELYRRGAQVRVLPGDALEIRPSRALDDALRAELRARKTEVVALLRSQPVATPAQAPAPTMPPPCSACSSVVWWRPDGTAELHCATCAPCPDRAAARWYTSPTSAVDIIVTELVSDPLVRRALDWAARAEPTLADRFIAALARIERAAMMGTPASDLFGQLEDTVDAVLRAEAGLDCTANPDLQTPTDAAHAWNVQ